jgi:cytochrome P450
MTETKVGVGGVYFDPFDLDIKANPYDTYRRLRDEAPLYYNEAHKFYAVSRFEDVERVLTDQERFISSKGGTIDVIQAGIESPPGLFINEDEPQHAKHRRLVSMLFTPKSMSAIEPQIREYCARTLDALVGTDGFDFVRDIGAQVPMRVVGMLVGIPESDQEALRDRFELSMHRPHDTDEDPFSEIATFAAVFGEFVDWRAEHPSDDLMTQLMTMEFEDENGARRLTRDELLIYLILIASAGNDTTNRLIGWTGKVLGDHPDQRRRLTNDRSIVNNAIDEILRFEPPPYHVARTVASDADFHGQTIPAESLIIVLPGAANRDEREFPNGDTFDVGRKIGHILTFGYGAHHCLGAALARLEGRVVLDELLQRFPDWEVDVERARLTPGFNTRGWDTLPVRLPHS